MTAELPTNFSEELRYSGYDLTPDSLVIDCGFYKGEFTLEMARRYDCWIEAYEPIGEFYVEGLRNVLHKKKIKLMNLAVGTSFLSNRIFHIKGGMTGEFNVEGNSQNVFVYPAWIAIGERDVDVLKLNVEGGEFEILESLTKLHPDRLALCKNIQVQFHQVVPNFQSRYESIHAKLLETHHLTYDFPWCWQNFRRNDAN